MRLDTETPNREQHTRLSPELNGPIAYLPRICSESSICLASEKSTRSPKKEAGEYWRLLRG